MCLLVGKFKLTTFKSSLNANNQQGIEYVLKIASQHLEEIFLTWISGGTKFDININTK